MSTKKLQLLDIEMLQSDWNTTDPNSISYIKNKPDGLEVAQADWEETNPDSAAYIKNKPDISSISCINQTVTLPTSGWSSKRINIDIEGVTADNTVFVAPHPDSQDTYSEAGIKCLSQDEGVLTFQYKNAPTVSIKVNVVIFS